jgi:hypothetical protein
MTVPAPVGDQAHESFLCLCVVGLWVVGAGFCYALAGVPAVVGVGLLCWCIGY